MSEQLLLVVAQAQLEIESQVGVRVERILAFAGILRFEYALDFALQHPLLRRITLVAPFPSLREEAALFVGAPLSHL